MNKTKLNILVSFLLLLSLTGCFGVNSEFKDVRNKVLNMINYDARKEIEIGVGAAGLALAGSFVRFAEEDDLPADIISYLSSVQIGVYENCYLSDKISLSEMNDFLDEMKDLGWQYIVRVKEPGNMVFIFVKTDFENSIEEMLVVTNNHSELFIATLEGKLDEIVTIAIKNKDFGIALSD